MITPQLATDIDVATLPRYCTDDTWWFQQKIDGHRLMLRITPERVIALNRKGELFGTSAADPIVRAMQPGATAILDGELLDGVYWVFDMPVASHWVNPTMPYNKRLGQLETVMKFAEYFPDCIRLLPTARTAEEKTTLAKRLLEANCEGVMLKACDAPYASGRRTRLVRKAKFVKTVDAIVMGLHHHGKDALDVGVYEGGVLRAIGAVSTINEARDARIGDVVEVRYLYAMLSNKRLVQPVFVRIRDDKAPDECGIDQLVYTNKEVLT